MQLRLCLVGFAFNSQEQAKISEIELTDRIQNYGHTADRYLAKLYRYSLTLVCPSFEVY